MKQLKTWCRIMTALGVVILSMACQSSPEIESTQARSIESKKKVKVAVVELKDFQPQFQTTGTLVAHRKGDIQALVPGDIAQLPVDIGTKVDRGQLLFEIRRTSYNLALQQAEANLLEATVVQKDRVREMNRIQNLLKEGFSTQQMSDQTMTAKEQADAALKIASAARDSALQALKDCTAVAAYQGVVTGKFLEPGEFAGVGDPVVELMDLTVLIAEVSLPEQYAGKILKGDRVTVSLNSQDRVIDAVVIAVNPKIDTESRTFMVKVSVDNADLQLQAGLFCSVNFSLPLQQAQPSVPNEALIRDEGKSFVWRFENGRVYSSPVKPGPKLDGSTMIIEGLKEGDSVVVDGMGGLNDGIEVDLES
jgi:membrane fusion protein, multidrug efflux system